MEFKNKVVVVTGASTGIGRAIAVEFAKAGATVVIISRNKDRLDQTLSLIRYTGGKAIAFPLDLRDTKAISKMAIEVKHKFGKVNVLVNVAGIYHSEDKAYYNIAYPDYTLEEVMETFEVGITAPAVLCHELLPVMQRGDKIINISGTFENGAKGWLPYYISKKALEDMTIGLADELKERQIQVNCISPSDTLTESYKKFFPEYAKEGSCLVPEDIARLAVSMASSKNHDNGKIVVIKKKRHS